MDRIVRLSEAAEILGCSTKTVQRLAKRDADFPKAVRVTERLSGFSADDLGAFIRRRREGNEAA